MTRATRAAALLIVSCALLVVPAGAIANPPTLAGIEDEVMCTVCGVPLSMAREAPAAKRQRALIAQLIAEGKTSDQIKAELVKTYGNTVLAVPAKSGFDLAAWLVPIIVVIVGLILLLLLLITWKRHRPPSDDTAQQSAQLSAEDTARVDAALADED